MEALRRNLFALLGLWLLATAGCHRLPASWYYAWNGYPEEPFETPGQRIERFKQLAASVGEKSPQQQQEISQQLASQFPAETDPLVRAQMVRTLAVYPTEAARATLFAALQDENEHVRIACCHAWRRRGGPDAVQALGGVLQQEEDVDVRLAAVRALGRFREQNVVPVLAGALEDNDVAIQHRAMVALENVTGRYYGRDVNKWRRFARGQDVPTEQRSLAERLNPGWF